MDLESIESPLFERTHIDKREVCNSATSSMSLTVIFQRSKIRYVGTFIRECLINGDRRANISIAGAYCRMSPFDYMVHLHLTWSRSRGHGQDRIHFY